MDAINLIPVTREPDATIIRLVLVLALGDARMGFGRSYETARQ